MRPKPAAPHRSSRVADQIRRDLAELIAREVKDPRVRFVTIQGVEVSPDYAHAKVYFSQLEGDPVACAAGLNQAAGFLRNALFRRLHIHTVPTLHFVFDATPRHAAALQELIAEAMALSSHDDSPAGADSPSASSSPSEGTDDDPASATASA
ncbi:ribosome-binding factor A [Candidatus Symbiobacter mobilis CR]|uniref:Ribosome-binding factor A n=1 Tax=Candidatus Symbiobacter mobilis CR TaxID=946483 RepID=U5N6S3_9BURK|nr:30S ribosome-binding factor RbfA [Candidatus Symbiobacter mobilis]AGX87082.1 ribosome-binding factor A [Candidatus Symbiobacter mobilis CR]